MRQDNTIYKFSIKLNLSQVYEKDILFYLFIYIVVKRKNQQFAAVTHFIWAQ